MRLGIDAAAGLKVGVGQGDSAGASVGVLGAEKLPAGGIDAFVQVDSVGNASGLAVRFGEIEGGVQRAGVSDAVQFRVNAELPLEVTERGRRPVSFSVEECEITSRLHHAWVGGSETVLVV
jgi:hypothetical protein